LYFISCPDTNFATIALALADDAVKTAHAGDFVEITGDIYHVIKTNPTVADDLLKGGGTYLTYLKKPYPCIVVQLLQWLKCKKQHHLSSKLLCFLSNKPDIHVNVLVSDTNFATIALALADDAVKTAHAGDFVEITGDIYHVIKTNPTVVDDLLKGSGEDLPPIITDNQVSYRCIKHCSLFKPT
jgi:hypothetical protein